MQSMVNTAISGSLHSTAGCRQAKMFLHGPDKQLTRFAMGTGRKHLRILTRLLTGHAAVNRHLIVMKIRIDPMCSFILY